MDPATIAPEDLDRAAIVWICYPHNPTGQDLPDELFEAWLAARERHGFVLCSDECYTEIYFGEKRPRSLLEFGWEGSLVFHSLSKRSGMTGYRSAMVTGDADIVGRYRKSRSAMGQAMPIPCQRASAAAWGDEAHVEQRREIFARKRDVMCTGLESSGSSCFRRRRRSTCGFVCPRGRATRATRPSCSSAGSSYLRGRFFGSGNEGWFRLALVPSVEGCEKAIERWSALDKG